MVRRIFCGILILFADYEQVCSEEYISYNGRYCHGVIASDEEDVCHDLFMPESHPLAVKSQDIQDFLLTNRDWVTATSSQLVIGLTSDNGSVYRYIISSMKFAQIMWIGNCMGSSVPTFLSLHSHVC